VSCLGLGLAALGRPAYITSGRTDDLGGERSTASMERRCHDVLDAAYAGGIRYVDAARSYGLAEAFLASWLARRRPGDPVFVASKWGYRYVGDWQMHAPVHETKDLSFEALVRQLGESRGILGNHLNLYQIHSATIESGVLRNQQVIRELARLRATGVEIGLTTTGPAQTDVIRQALMVKADGVSLFQSVQSTWNLLETSAGAALSEAHDYGWRVVIKEALANGRLSGRGEEHEIGPLIGMARELNVTADALALAAALRRPWADVVLSGAVTPEQLRSNLNAKQVAPVADWPSMAQVPGDYWASRAKRQWG